MLRIQKGGEGPWAWTTPYSCWEAMLKEEGIKGGSPLIFKSDRVLSPRPESLRARQDLTVGRVWTALQTAQGPGS